MLIYKILTFQSAESPIYLNHEQHIYVEFAAVPGGFYLKKKNYQNELVKKLRAKYLIEIAHKLSVLAMLVHNVCVYAHETYVCIQYTHTYIFITSSKDHSRLQATCTCAQPQ